MAESYGNKPELPKVLRDLEEAQCPVCGYYCLGKGGHGCIDKPGLVRHNTPPTPPPNEPPRAETVTVVCTDPIYPLVVLFNKTRNEGRLEAYEDVERRSNATSPDDAMCHVQDRIAALREKVGE